MHETIERVTETTAAKNGSRVTQLLDELPVLPNFSVTARPDNLMPSSAPWSDATLVSKSFSF